tara:strand:+ start:157 stop:366 length:210 start_codon:yes stop_codon:yes gene_type:complete
MPDEIFTFDGQFTNVTEIFMNCVAGNTLIPAVMLLEDEEFMNTASSLIQQGVDLEELIDRMTDWANENY